MEYDAQEVVDNAYRHSYQILEYLLKTSKDENIIINVKNLVYYLEDYAFWKEEDPKPIKKEGKEGSPPTSVNEGSGQNATLR